MHQTQLSSIHLHPAHFNVHPALCNTLTNIARNWAIFPNLGPKNQSCPFCLKTGTDGDADSYYNINVLKLHPQNPFFSKFEPKKLKLSVLSKSRSTWPLKDANFYCNISFLNFRPWNSFLGKFGKKNWKLSVLSENWHSWYLEDANFYSNIRFMAVNSFLDKFSAKKSKLPSCLKNGPHDIFWFLFQR